MYRFLILRPGAIPIKVTCYINLPPMYRSVEFEVFGRVQGVFFRKFAKDEADRLGVRGWCRNSAYGSVLGVLEGPPDEVDTMMIWLKSIGSPSSRIDAAEFNSDLTISEYTYDNFTIVKD